jgi:hypothetical protein
MLNLSREELSILHQALANTTIKVKDIQPVMLLVEKIENEFSALSSQEVQPKEEPKAARSRAKK